MSYVTAVTYDATVSSTTAVTLNSLTTEIEVTAVDKGIFLKWNGAASTTSFDAFIPANMSKRFIRPPDAVTANFIEEQSTAHLVLIEI